MVKDIISNLNIRLVRLNVYIDNYWLISRFTVQKLTEWTLILYTVSKKRRKEQIDKYKNKTIART